MYTLPLQACSTSGTHPPYAFICFANSKAKIPNWPKSCRPHIQQVDIANTLCTRKELDLELSAPLGTAFDPAQKMRSSGLAVSVKRLCICHLHRHTRGRLPQASTIFHELLETQPQRLPQNSSSVVYEQEKRNACARRINVT